MSTDTDTDTSSNIRQFGLYRSIDARTEEFLKLSRKRQIKQGCACAAISTVITVAVVIVVLLIYEYMIAVETSFKYKRRILNNTRHIRNETPIADRLDRNYFGVDQDYYEKIPLLVNALQEKYTDVEVPSSRKKYSSKSYLRLRPRTTTAVNRFIRKTSPRPFVFEYRSQYPMPFSKSSKNPKNWIEQYRNAQRMKNLHEVVKYLEKTLNAKFGELYLPTKTQIGYSGLYHTPVQHDNSNPLLSGSMNVPQNGLKSNHYADPLYIFKPDNPGDVNLLADGFRFAPSLIKTPNEKNPKLPIEPSSGNEREHCVGEECLPYNRNIIKSIEIPFYEDVKSTYVQEFHNKQKTFSFIPDVNQPISTFPHNDINELDKIYITTSKPLFQFRRKTTIPSRRISHRNKRPKFLRDRRKNYSNANNFNKVTTAEPVLHFLGSKEEGTVTNNVNFSETLTDVSSAEETAKISTVANYPSFSNVEDYHVGSSGVIPIEYNKTPEVYPIVTPIIPITDIFLPFTDSPITNPPDIVKFSPEDAKIPDQYLNLGISKLDEDVEIEDSWRNFESTKINSDEVEAKTLIIKLKNKSIVESTTSTDITDDISQSEYVDMQEDIETTTETYVPQINGHYRNVRRKTLVLLQENSEKYRKKRLENLILTTIKPTYVPLYVEIKRNRTNTVDSDNN